MLSGTSVPYFQTRPGAFRCVWFYFKSFLMPCFLSAAPVDSAFYLIRPKHTSLISAAGCVRGRVCVAAVASGSCMVQLSGEPCRGHPTQPSPLYFIPFFLHLLTSEPALLTYIFINTPEVEGRSRWGKGGGGG